MSDNSLSVRRGRKAWANVHIDPRVMWGHSLGSTE